MDESGYVLKKDSPGYGAATQKQTQSTASKQASKSPGTKSQGSQQRHQASSAPGGSGASNPAGNPGKNEHKAWVKSSGVNIRTARKEAGQYHIKSVIEKLPGGTPVNVLGDEFDDKLSTRTYHWVHVTAHTRKGVVDGWVASGFLSNKNPNPKGFNAWIVPGGASLRTCGSVCTSVGKLPGNTHVSYLGGDKYKPMPGDRKHYYVWVHIKTPAGRTGYVRSDYINFDRTMEISKPSQPPKTDHLTAPSSTFEKYNNSSHNPMRAHKDPAYKELNRQEAMPGYNSKTGHTDEGLVVALTVPPTNSNDAEFLNQAKKFAAATGATGVDLSAVTDKDTHVIYAKQAGHKTANARLVKNRPIVVNNFNDLANAIKMVSKASGKKIKYLAIFAHGDKHGHIYGHDPNTKNWSKLLDKKVLEQQVAEVSPYLADDVHIAFFSCNAAMHSGKDKKNGGVGEEFVGELAKYKKSVTLLSHNVSGHTVDNPNTGLYTAQQVQEKNGATQIKETYRSQNWRWDDVFDRSFRDAERKRLGNPKDWSTNWDNHKRYERNAFVTFYEHFAWMYLKPGMKFEDFKNEMRDAWKRAYPNAAAVKESSADAKKNVYKNTDQNTMLANISGMPYEDVLEGDTKDLYVYPTANSPVIRRYAKGTIVGYLWSEKSGKNTMYYVTTPDGRAGYMNSSGLKKRDDLVALQQRLADSRKSQQQQAQATGQTSQQQTTEQPVTTPASKQNTQANQQVASTSQKAASSTSKPAQQAATGQKTQKTPLPYTPPPKEVTAHTLYVTGHYGAHIRKTPAGQLLGKVPFGTQLTVLDSQAPMKKLGDKWYHWVHVSTKTEKGYIALSLLGKESPVTHMYVTGKYGAHIRKEPAGKLLGTLPSGTKVTVLDKHSHMKRLGGRMYSWVHVSSGSMEGYVASTLLGKKGHDKADGGGDTGHDTPATHGQPAVHDSHSQTATHSSSQPASTTGGAQHAAAAGATQHAATSTTPATSQHVAAANGLGVPHSGTYTVSPKLSSKLHSYYSSRERMHTLGPWVSKFAAMEGLKSPVTVDNAFITKLKAFQKAHGLTQDGELGPSAISTLIRSDTAKDPKKQQYMDNAKSSAFAMTGHFETGKKTAGGIHGTWQAYDRGLLSYGFIQFTVASGSLHKVMQAYVRMGGSKAARMQQYLNEYSSLKSGLQHYYARAPKNKHGYVYNWYSNLRKMYPKGMEFGEFLQSLGSDSIMQKAQHEVATGSYWNTALGVAGMFGIESQLGLEAIFDATVQHGGGGAKKLAYQAMNSAVEVKSGLVIPRGKVGDKTGNRHIKVISEAAFIAKFAKVRLNKFGSASANRAKYVLDKALAEMGR